LIDDPVLLALCGFQEANLEPDDGLAAVVRVVLNRMRLKYQSDGTVRGAVYWPDAFSWTQWAMAGGHYVKVAHDAAQVAARSAALLDGAQAHPAAWTRASRIAAAVQAGEYRGPDYDRLGDAAVLYLNPALSRAAWATPDKRICAIGHHEFFHA